MVRSVLEIDELSVSYGNHLLFENVSFSLNKGTICAVMGPNGSGKTTLLKIISGMKNPDKGVVKINGKKVSDVSANEIGYVPQIKTINRNFPAKAFELVLSPVNKSWPAIVSKSMKKRALDALGQVSAAHLANREISQLSGGELQRVYLARSLITSPSLLLLDEPATGVDMLCESRLNEIISQARSAQNTTVLMVTHDISSAHYHSDCTLLLNKEMIFFGDTKDAFTEENIQKTFSHMGHQHDVKLAVKNA